jgi:hypothetical protein
MIEKHTKLNTLMYLYNDNSSLPKNFSGAFSWRGDYKLKEKMWAFDRQSTDGERQARFTIPIENDYLTEFDNTFWHFPVYEDTSHRRLFSYWSLDVRFKI